MTKDDHGSASTYINHSCRCKECKAAWSKMSRAGQLSRLARGIPDEDPRHGSEYCYQNYCRKPCCRGAHAKYTREARKRKQRRDYLNAVRESGENFPIPDL